MTIPHKKTPVHQCHEAYNDDIGPPNLFVYSFTQKPSASEIPLLYGNPTSLSATLYTGYWLSNDDSNLHIATAYRTDLHIATGHRTDLHIATGYRTDLHIATGYRTDLHLLLDRYQTMEGWRISTPLI